MFGRLPGKYLDPSYVRSGVAETGGFLIGYLEADQKPGTYPIKAVNYKTLRFYWEKVGQVVHPKSVNHPFLSGSLVIERYFRERKPWLIEQIEDAVFDVVYNAR